MARMASKAMAAPKISHSHQFPKRRVIFGRTEHRCDEACFSRGVVESALRSNRVPSLGVNIAIEERALGIDFLRVESKWRIGMLADLSWCISLGSTAAWYLSVILIR